MQLRRWKLVNYGRQFDWTNSGITGDRIASRSRNSPDQGPRVRGGADGDCRFVGTSRIGDRERDGLHTCGRIVGTFAVAARRASWMATCRRGIVDGANATFALAAVPAPASSLSVYRNGMLQKPGFDYTATGNSIQFVVAATPQPADTLLASYRTADSSGAVTSAFTGFSTVQVLCSGTGATINSPSLVSLGTCAIPAGLLSQGDRIEIRFDYAHGGAAGGFSIEPHWGGTTIVHRDALLTETLVTGRADAGASRQKRAAELGNLGIGAGDCRKRSRGRRCLRKRPDHRFPRPGG